MTKLSQHNSLAKGENGVWVLEGEVEPFDYSDGADAERYLREVFAKSKDLSAQSYELQQAIYDWPSEYHLSPKRGNLFRPFDLSVFESVLDIGSGCGAIARYLGEHINLVDAVEGAPIRADLARKRCADLDNVNIINANFNHLALKGADYQLATLIGVVEYAGKFLPEAPTDRDAAIGLLSNVATALDGDGVVMIAIENRLGAKYILGAPEDHYHSPNEGIVGYPRKHGMCTYDLTEWRSILAETDFRHHLFYGAFYDYKLPTLLVGEEFAQNPHIINHLEGYAPSLGIGTWCKGKADMMWRALSQLNRVMEASNSFFIIAAKSQAGLNRLTKLDFAHSPSFSRRLAFNTVVMKASQSEEVQRVPILNEVLPRHAQWSFEPKNEPLFQGKVLLAKWLELFSLQTSLNEGLELLADYYSYIQSLEEAGELQIDALPQNVLITESGFQLFDQEWAIKDYPIDGPLSEYVFFRALMYLSPYADKLGEFYTRFGCRTHYDLIRELLLYFEIKCGRHLDDFLNLEQDFLQYVEGREVSLEYLNRTIADERLFDAAPWLWAEASIEKVDDETSSWAKRYPLNEESTIIDIELGQPHPLSDGDIFVFKPCDFRRPAGTGLFVIDVIRLLFVDGTYLDLDVEKAQVHGICTAKNHGRMVYAIDGVAPELRLELTGINGKTLKGVHVEMLMRSSPEYWQIDQKMMVERDRLKVEIAYLRRQIMRPNLPTGTSIATPPVPSCLPEELKSKKRAAFDKITYRNMKVQPLSKRAIPMDWRFMPPLENVESGSRLDGVTLVVAISPDRHTLKALSHLAVKSEVLVIGDDDIASIVQHAKYDWLLILDEYHVLQSFRIEASQANARSAMAFYGDARIRHDGWFGVRQEPQRLKHALLSGYSGIGAILLNPYAKTKLSNSSVRVKSATMAHLFAVQAILDGIEVAHLGSVASEVYYPTFVWPPSQKVVDGITYARQSIADARPHCLFPQQNSADGRSVDGLISMQYAANPEPKVSIIIPFKDNPSLLENCILKIIENSWYENYEIIGVNNGSTMDYTYKAMEDLEANYESIRFVHVNEAFNFSKLVNFGVANSDGEYIVFMNNDVLVDTPDWISYLLGPFCVDEKCAVTGACLNYPEGVVQSCGIAIGEEGLPVNVANNLMVGDKALFGRLYASRDVLAVSAALMMTKRTVFEDIGGFDEVNFAIAFNDVDYCLRAVDAGYDVVAVGAAKAFHFESYSRSSDLSSGQFQRFRNEQQAFRTIHIKYAESKDPYHPEIERKI